MTGAFQAVIAGVHAQEPVPAAEVNPGLPLERLRSMGSVEFRGSDPSSAEEWLTSTERILDQMECRDMRRLSCVISLLQGDAYRW